MTHTDRYIQRHTDRHRDTKRHMQTQRVTQQTHIHTDVHTDIHTETQTHLYQRFCIFAKDERDTPLWGCGASRTISFSVFQLKKNV